MHEAISPPADLRILQPSQFCQYASGPCDQSFGNLSSFQGFFQYPFQPQIIANTVEQAIQVLKRTAPGYNWLSWQEMDITGQIIFCQICKAMRSTNSIIADVTTLIFNVLFEIGYGIGLGLPIIPIVDLLFPSEFTT